MNLLSIKARTVCLFTTLILLTSIITIRSHIGVSESEENSKIPLTERLKSAFEALREKPLILEGTIVDQDGNSVNAVPVEIRKTKGDWTRLKSHDEKEKKILKSTFSLEYRGYDGVEVTFKKPGYRYHKISAFHLPKRYQDQYHKDESIKRNLRIILNNFGDLTKGLINRAMILGSETEYGTGRLKKQGWNSENIENKIYFNPNEIDFYASLNTEGELYLVANSPAGIYLVNSNSNNFDPQKLTIAPDADYKSRIRIDPNDKNYQYLYFRTRNRLFGKLKISPIGTYVKGNDYFIAEKYFLNPAGTRHLNTIEF